MDNTNNYYNSYKFRQKLQEKSKEEIAPGAKMTYAQLAEVDKMAKRSLDESRQRRKKIAAVEKRKKKEKVFLIQAGLIILAAALIAAFAKGPGEGKAFDHNGDVINIEQSYNPGR